MTHSDAPPPSTIGLLLTGGGARAAYQVGVLEAIADLRQACGAGDQPNPFAIITGTSAGAINAAALACGADNFDMTVRRIVSVWHDFRADQVYQSDIFSVMRSGAKWLSLLSVGWLIARWRRLKPRSLLDNSPLVELLRQMVPLERLPRLIEQGHLRALAVTASSYSSGHHVTFFQGDDGLQPWVRSQRLAVRQTITLDHLLASSAIPFVFPAMPLQIHGRTEYFGDGSMRQTAPAAPPIHLGAERILVVGAGRMHEPRGGGEALANHSYPSLAQIAGHAMSSIFLDALAVDVERIRRINQTLALVPAEARRASALRPIDLLLIAPSERLDRLAARHIDALPAAVRTMLGGMGISSNAADIKGGALVSYLLFEAAYTRDLIQLGYADALRQKDELLRFFGWRETSDFAGPAAPAAAHAERRRDPLRV